LSPAGGLNSTFSATPGGCQFHRAESRSGFYHFLYKKFWRRGASGEADGFGAAQHTGIECWNLASVPPSCNRFEFEPFLAAGLAGHRDQSPLLHTPLPLAMNLRRQRTCSIKDRQSKRGGFVLTGVDNGVRAAPRPFQHTGTFFPGLGSAGHPLLNVLTELWLTLSSDWR
jgi:hypothetical protein